jgi:hypothetical protein
MNEIDHQYQRGISAYSAPYRPYNLLVGIKSHKMFFSVVLLVQPRLVCFTIRDLSYLTSVKIIMYYGCFTLSTSIQYYKYGVIGCTI